MSSSLVYVLLLIEDLFCVFFLSHVYVYVCVRFMINMMFFIGTPLIDIVSTIFLVSFHNLFSSLLDAHDYRNLKCN